MNQGEELSCGQRYDLYLQKEGWQKKDKQINLSGQLRNEKVFLLSRAPSILEGGGAIDWTSFRV